MQSPAPMNSESELVRRVQAGDDAAFEQLIEKHHASLVRFARGIVRDDAQAEEVVQDAWTALVSGAEQFEGRSSLKTWLFRVTANRARTRAVREARSVPLSALEDYSGGDEAFSPEGRWARTPSSWPDLSSAASSPEGELVRGELRAALQEAVDALPPNQRAVLLLRDVEGLDSKEVCNILGLSETNERVILHRARVRLRAALQEWVDHLPSGGRR